MILSSKNKIKYINFVAGLVFIGTIMIFAVYFLKQQIKTTSSKLISKKTELVAAENREKLINDLNAESSILEKEIRVIENTLPNRDSIINFIKDLELLAAEKNIKMSLTFNEKPEVDPQTGNLVLIFNINLEGDDNAVNNFVQEINKLPYFLTVYNVNENIESDNIVRISSKFGVFVNENF